MSQGKLFEESEYLPDDQQELISDERESFDSSQVVLYSTDWTVDSVINQIKKKRINLNPSFQRRQAWSEAHRSSFIESLVLNIPIPQIVLAEDPENIGSYIVIDGKQRLLSLAQYVQTSGDGSNKALEHFKPYKLNGLIKSGHGKLLNGNYFEQLPIGIQAKIENSVLRTVIIRSVKNNKFLYEVFLRLNQGSKPLSPQELRQALASGEFTDWLDKFVCKSKPLQAALRLKEPDPRMRDTEVALRFMAFRESLNGYHGYFKEFLDEYMLFRNRVGVSEVLGEELELAINTTIDIFGKHSFEKFEAEKLEYTGKFNRAVFDCMSYYFADEKVAAKATTKKIEVKQAFESLCINSIQFRSSIETSFKNVHETFIRLSEWGNTLQTVLQISLPKVEIVEGRISVTR